MKHTVILATAALALALTACAGAVPGNPQSYAGINEGRAEFTDDGKPKSIRFIGGKENENISLSLEMANGTKVSYTAVGAKAFDGQSVRAAVEQAVSADLRQVFPDIVETLTDALTKKLGL